MPPSSNPVGAPAPNPTPTPQPAPAPVPATPVADPSQPVPFNLGTPGEITPPAAPAPAAEQMPEWAKQFVGEVSEKLTGFEAALTAEEQPGAPDPSAPIGAPASASELAARNPQSWEDVDRYVNEKIQEGVQQGLTNFQQGIQDANTEAERARQEVDAELDAQVDELERSGFLPPIVNPNDRNDPGRIYRRELYGAAAKMGTTNLKEVAQLTLAPLHQQGKIYDPQSDSFIDYAPEVPGAQSPIGSSSATTGMTQTGPSYKDIHQARSFDELRARAGLE